MIAVFGSVLRYRGIAREKTRFQSIDLLEWYNSWHNRSRQEKLIIVYI